MIQQAIYNNDDETLDELLQNGHADPTDALFELVKAPKEPNFKIVTTILQFIPDLNSKDEKGNAPIHYAAQSKSLQDLRVLLCQPRIYQNIGQKEGMTALMIAVEEQSLEKVRLCLQWGCCPYIINKHNE